MINTATLIDTSKSVYGLYEVAKKGKKVTIGTSNRLHEMSVRELSTGVTHRVKVWQNTNREIGKSGCIEALSVCEKHRGFEMCFPPTLISQGREEIQCCPCLLEAVQKTY